MLLVFQLSANRDAFAKPGEAAAPDAVDLCGSLKLHLWRAKRSRDKIDPWKNCHNLR
jgi:hypothetical protein